MGGSLRNPNAIRRHLWPILAVASVLLAVLLWSWGRALQNDSPQAVESSTSAGPPWRYGRLDARFTLVEYADLECPC